jgi:hypothetical protein
MTKYTPLAGARHLPNKERRKRAEGKFRNEPGVLEVGNEERMHRRKKKAFVSHTRFTCAGTNVIVQRRKPSDIFVHIL